MEVKVYLCVLVLQVVICSVWCQEPTTPTVVEEMVTVIDDVTTLAPVAKTSPAAAVNGTVTKASDKDGDNDGDDDNSAEDEDDEDTDSLSGGAVAGIIIGVILGLVLIIIIVYVVISKVCTTSEPKPAPAKKQSDVKYSEVEKGETADKVTEEENKAETEIKA